MAISYDFQEFIDEIIEKNDIVEVVSQYTKLKRVGNRFQALCPLHNDKKTPSFSVSPDKQLFHCFGCGAGGTVINFIMEKENLDFMEAVKLLADRSGLSVPDNKTPRERIKMAEVHDKKQKMYKMNSDAGKFFYTNLVSPKYAYALEYFQKRHITDKTIRSFGLGYAPDNWTSLIEHLKELGYTEKEIEEGGLAIKRENGTYFDKFRDRVMFPIIDLRGNVIAFGGRIIRDKENSPKYLNSPETLVFKKSENLFAMNIAKNSKEDQLLLMEGYMDVISLHQNGFTNAVASLGTAFTPQHAQIVKKYAGKAVLCYDADEAGQKATDRVGEILTEAQIRTKVLKINSGKDPDEYINSKGADMFALQIENAESFMEYKIHKIKAKYNLEDDIQKVEFIEKVSKVFAAMKNPVEQEVFIKKIARETDISPDTIFAQIQNDRRIENIKQIRQEKFNNLGADVKRQNMKFSPDEKRLNDAEKLLLNLICDKEIYNIVKKEISPEDFSSSLHREIAHILYDIHSKDEKINPAGIVSMFDSEKIGFVSEILSDDKNVDDKKQAVVMPLSIIKQYIAKQKEKQLLARGDIAELQSYMEQLKKEKK